MGSVISDDSRVNASVTSRITLSKCAFNQMRQFLYNNNINTAIKTGWLTVIYGVYYGCENLILNNQMTKKLKVPEMWVERQNTDNTKRKSVK